MEKLGNFMLIISQKRGDETADSGLICRTRFTINLKDEYHTGSQAIRGKRP